MSKYKITVLTPTYNRKECLGKLYESLCEQTELGFQWLVIDDGSTDQTERYIKSLKAEFAIDFYRKNNGGKHTALNYSHPYIEGDLVCIVDSDDWLVNDAIEVILRDWTEYESKRNIAGLTYLRKQKNGELASSKFLNEIEISNVIDFRLNAEVKGDCFEVLRKSVFIERRFPEYDGERFVPEGYLWNYVGTKYETVYINKPLYMCEYLEGGLTKSGRMLRIKSAKGCMEHCLSFFEANKIRKIKIKILIKQAVFYVAYSRFAGCRMKEMFKRCNSVYVILGYIPGNILYQFWKKKYC